MKRLSILLITICLLLPEAVSAQRPQRDKKRDKTEAVQPQPTYEDMLDKCTELKRSEITIEKQLSEARELFSAGGPGKENLGNRIMELEKQLFSLREELDTLTERINVMEQEQGYSRPAPMPVTTDRTPKKAMLTANAYFRDNMQADDYALLMKAQSQETAAAATAAEIKSNYDRMAILLSTYYIVDKGPQADSIYNIIVSLADANETLAASLANVWNGIFETKIYSYNYILDKNGERVLLEDQERQMNNLRLLESETNGEYMYNSLARYALEKLLITGYETRIADMAGLSEAVDSLGSLVPPTQHIDDFFLKKLDTRERMFYDLSDVELVKPAKYANTNRIPKVEIFPRGSIYRILLGAYSRPQPVSIFKGAYPMSQETKADKKHYYYAGGYSTLEEASAAAARLKKQGFRNPQVVAWHDGVYDGAASGQSKNSATTGTVKYRIEITGAGDSLSRMVRDAITNQAAGKEISRLVNAENGETMFIVGSFNTKALADTLAADITAADPSLNIKVVPIQ